MDKTITFVKSSEPGILTATLSVKNKTESDLIFLLRSVSSPIDFSPDMGAVSVGEKTRINLSKHDWDYSDGVLQLAYSPVLSVRNIPSDNHHGYWDKIPHTLKLFKEIRYRVDPEAEYTVGPQEIAIHSHTKPGKSKRNPNFSTLNKDCHSPSLMHMKRGSGFLIKNRAKMLGEQFVWPVKSYGKGSNSKAFLNTAHAPNIFQFRQSSLNYSKGSSMMESVEDPVEQPNQYEDRQIEPSPLPTTTGQRSRPKIIYQTKHRPPCHYYYSQGKWCCSLCPQHCSTNEGWHGYQDRLEDKTSVSSHQFATGSCRHSASASLPVGQGTSSNSLFAPLAAVGVTLSALFFNSTF